MNDRTLTAIVLGLLAALLAFPVFTTELVVEALAVSGRVGVPIAVAIGAITAAGLLLVSTAPNRDQHPVLLTVLGCGLAYLLVIAPRVMVEADVLVATVIAGVVAAGVGSSATGDPRGSTDRPASTPEPAARLEGGC